MSTDLPPLPILSGLPEQHYATALLRLGANGYLNKTCDPDEMVLAIRTVCRGRRYISAGVAEMLADGLCRSGDQPPHERLSQRELQVFMHLALIIGIGNQANILEDFHRKGQVFRAV